MNLLLESILVEYKPEDSKLEYLEEYLIVVPKITLKEAKSLIFLIEQDEVGAKSKIKSQYDKAVEKINGWYKKAVEQAKKAGTWTSEKAASLKKIFTEKMTALNTWRKEAWKNVSTQAGKAKGFVKSAFYKKGPASAGNNFKGETLKGLKNLKTGSKVGLAAAAATVGYGAYRAAKSKK